MALGELSLRLPSLFPCIGRFPCPPLRRVLSPAAVRPCAAAGVRARVGVMEFGWALRRPMRLPDSPRHERGLPAALRGVGVKPEEREGRLASGPHRAAAHGGGGDARSARLGLKPADRLWRGRRRARTVAGDGNWRREAAADSAKAAAAAEAAAQPGTALGGRGRGKEGEGRLTASWPAWGNTTANGDGERPGNGDDRHTSSETS
uniref:Uncharacterized protein n=1 Tax=Oryza sativa subsp. japonica TaxID=39947 RepID=Q6H5N9_ORYSJ|nr:hypothetical protein [Oryza sativa Japonica Group]